MELKPGYKKTEIGVIPEDWEVKPLGSVVIQRPRYGINAAAKEPTGRHPRYLRITDITESGRLSKLEFKEVDHKDSQHYFLDQGDIVIARTGASVGKSFLYDTDIEPMVFAGFLICIKADQSVIDPYYLSQRLQTKSYSDWVLQTSMRSGQPGINSKELSELAILVPQLSEQKLISSFISDIDSLITSLEKLIEKKKLIKQGAMQELLTGKRRLPGFNGVWMTKRYGDIFQFLSTANYTREDLTDTGSLKYIHYGDIHTKFENYVDLSDALIPTIQDCWLKNYPLLESGDIIMVDASEDYSGVGKSVEVINSNGCKAISGLHTILLRDISKIFADGYRAFIHSIPSVKAQLDFYATGMKVYSISKVNLAIIEIPVPPKNEQEAIVNALSSFVDEIKALEVRLAKSILLKKAMMQELLTGRIRLV